MNIRTGCLLAVIKPGGLFVIHSPLLLSMDRKIVHEDKVFSRYIPIGEIFLCLEANYHNTESLYGLKILWKDYIYYVICDPNDIKVVG